MKLLWTEDLKMNTVHVSDVARGLWFLGQHGGENGEVYNMVDSGMTSESHHTHCHTLTHPLCHMTHSSGSDH